MCIIIGVYLPLIYLLTNTLKTDLGVDEIFKKNHRMLAKFHSGKQFVLVPKFPYCMSSAPSVDILTQINNQQRPRLKDYKPKVLQKGFKNVSLEF